jgi:hypothetical protein
MADPTTVTNKKTTFDADSNPDFAVFTDEVVDPVSGATVKKQLVGLVDATADGTGRIAGDATNGLDVDVTRLPGGTLAAAAQVTVTGAAGTLIVANAARKGLTIRSLSTNTQSIFIGPAVVTTTTGMEIKVGETAWFSPGEVPTNLVQAISASGSQTIIVQEVA